MTETTNLKDGIKPSGKGFTQENINLSPTKPDRKPERKAQPQAKPSGPKPATRIDIDGTLVGRKVALYVETGNVANVVIGTVITMGSFWVIVKVEKTNLPFIRDIAYINKAYIIMYSPLPEGEEK